MNLSKLLIIIQDEKKCEEYLREVGILKTFNNCPFCSSARLALVRRNLMKCYECKREWSMKTGSILNLFQVSFSNFLLVIKLFELGITAGETSRQLDIDSKKVHKIFIQIRKCIANIADNDLEKIQQIIKDKSVPFYLWTDKESIIIGINNSDKKATAKIIATRSRIQKSSVIYSYSIYDLINSIEQKKFYNFNLFWRFAKARLINYKGTENTYLYLVLKEIEFRFNNRKEDIYKIIMLKIAQNFKVAKTGS